MILFKSLSFLAQNLLFALAGIIGIGFVIGIHELGHFLFCKLFNIRTPTFSIGFGPQIFKKKIGETQFALSAIPLGGYVEIAGSAEMGQGEQKEAHSKDSHSFAVKPYYQKLLVLIGGILVNLIFAYLALILLFMIGLPKTVPVIRTIQPESAAAKYQLAPGDKILAIDSKTVDNDLAKTLSLIVPLADKETTILVERGGQEINIPITIGSKKDGSKSVGSLGVTFEMIKTAGLPFFEAVKSGIELTNNYIMGTLKGLKNIFVKRDVSDIQGPLSIISLIMEGISQSFGVFLLLLALISINLAILNLILPLPILDGGQILFYTIEAIIRRPIPVKLKEYIHIGSWLLVLGLILWLSAQDLIRMIKPLFAKIMGN